MNTFKGKESSPKGQDARTLLCTPKNNVEIKLIGSTGTCAHYGLKAILELFACVDQNVILIFVDGLIVPKSSRSEIFTILGEINNCEALAQSFITGAHHGPGKPACPHEFMGDFLEELTDLNVDGFFYNDVYYRVEGDFSYYAPLRTNDNCTTGVPEEYENSTSPLEGFLDIMIDVPLDPMHHLHLGVGKNHANLFLSSLKSLGSEDLMKQLDDDYSSLKNWTPMEFGRKPRDFSEFSHFEAVEHRMIVLYTGPVIFSKYIQDEKILHFNLLNLASCYLTSGETCISKNADAKELMILYVDEMRELYGDHNIIYCVHNCIHLPDDVLRHSSLDSFSAFTFENHLRFVRKNVRQGNQVLSQVTKRSNEQAIVAMSRSRTKLKEKLMMKPSEFYLTNQLKKATLPDGYENAYKFIKCTHFTLTSSIPNNCCYLTDGSLVSIQYICEESGTGQKVILYNEFENLCSIENYPIDSRETGVCETNDLKEDLMECSVSLIQVKVFQMYFNNQFYFFPLLY
ncbi:hypothetical protein QAD02_008324 [Eretmocerus hayati]|uniref:Uncharacterized protein n=1 Tax=Eretmocerus hayati TaxID=131215 RepID=A0ACC2N683_9HYME|nr:hypothetical protein QAD02_008324 [Eretmocerus hayati]